MIADRTTETIEHFIGLFDLAIEKARLRDTYDEFTALRRKAEMDGLKTVDYRIDAPHELKIGRFDPSAPYTPLPAHDHDGPRTKPLPPLEAPLPPWDPQVEPEEPDGPGIAVPEAWIAPPTAPVHSPAIVPHQPPAVSWPVPDIHIPFPGSVLTVTAQTATLHDSDRIGDGPFRSSADHAESFQQIAHLAGKLHVAPDLAFGHGEILRFEDAMAIADAMRDARPVSSGNDRIESVVLHGQQASGLFVNGVAAESAPDWQDLLPEHFQRETQSSDISAAAIEARAFTENYTPNPDFEDGHRIVAGANLLVNDTTIYNAWVDAPNIAVGGRWITLDLIDQVAAVSNTDAGGGIPLPSTVTQIAGISEESAPAEWYTSAVSAGGGAPDWLLIDHIEGDLVVSHSVKQIIDVIDEDLFFEEISAASSAFVLGGNTVINAAGILAAGVVYDLILIGGDLIQYNGIRQTLVLEDDDLLHGVPQPMAADDGSGIAHPLAEKPAGQGLDDLVAAADDPLPAPADGAAGQGAGPAPDNLLVNEAHIGKIGTDISAGMSDTLASILSAGDATLESLRDTLLGNPLLAGLEQARVLRIDGDLIQTSVVEQIIRLRDSDDIFVQGQAPGGLEVIAGSNALVNSASVINAGVDSKIMAAEQGYSDLLIHQASLIDEMKETMDQKAEVVSEAIAFLMDDMEDQMAGIAAAKDGLIHPAVDSDDLIASMGT
ncbi:hypothetical protein [Tropicimonas sp.]|uniref:hypothetical protein n=1 Tax=Tropicimonas sp. TaxID=2067044 RepID=UPI003A85B653